MRLAPARRCQLALCSALEFHPRRLDVQALHRIGRLECRGTFQQLRSLCAAIPSEGALAGFDLAVSPTLALHPPPAGEMELGLIRFTSVWDQNGWPAITVPVGLSPVNGMPIGFQIIGRPWQEGLLLRAARVIEHSHALAFPPRGL